MKINKIAQPKQSINQVRQLPKEVPGYTKIVMKFYGPDARAIDTAMRRFGNKPNVTADKVVVDLIDERSKLEEITVNAITQEDYCYHTEMRFFLPDEQYETLSMEASKNSLSLVDYLRGIIYSVVSKMEKEDALRRKAEEQRKYENRIVKVEIGLDKDIREKLYKRFGKVTDKELQALLKEKFVEWI